MTDENETAAKRTDEKKAEMSEESGLLCQCGHGWFVHSNNTGLCRFDGCKCKQFAQQSPPATDSNAATADEIEQILNEIKPLLREVEATHPLIGPAINSQIHRLALVVAHRPPATDSNAGTAGEKPQAFKELAALLDDLNHAIPAERRYLRSKVEDWFWNNDDVILAHLAHRPPAPSEQPKVEGVIETEEELGQVLENLAAISTDGFGAYGESDRLIARLSRTVRNLKGWDER